MRRINHAQGFELIVSLPTISLPVQRMRKLPSLTSAEHFLFDKKVVSNLYLYVSSLSEQPVVFASFISSWTTWIPNICRRKEQSGLPSSRLPLLSAFTTDAEGRGEQACSDDGCTKSVTDCSYEHRALTHRASYRVDLVFSCVLCY